MANTVRLALAGRAEQGLTDQDTGNTPAAWEGDALDIAFWLGSICADEDPFDIDDIETLTLTIKEAPDSTDMLTAAIDFDGADLVECLRADFISGDSQHGTFELSDAQMVFDSTIEQVWMSFRALLTDGTHRTFGAGFFTIAQGGTDSGPVVNLSTLFLRATTGELTADGTLTVTMNGKFFELTPSDFRDTE